MTHFLLCSISHLGQPTKLSHILGRVSTLWKTLNLIKGVCLTAIIQLQARMGIYYSLFSYMPLNSISRLAFTVETNNHSFLENLICFLKQQAPFLLESRCFCRAGGDVFLRSPLANIKGRYFSCKEPMLMTYFKFFMSKMTLLWENALKGPSGEWQYMVMILI